MNKEITINNYTFEILPQSWYKRRKPTAPERQLTHYEVLDFQKTDGHRCQIIATFDDNETLTLEARVYVNRTHTINDDGSLSYTDNSWGIQGMNADGVSVVLRLLE